MNTSHKADSVVPILEKGCDQIYHNHTESDEPSQADIFNVNDLMKKDYKEAIIYNESTDKTNKYWDKEDGFC